MIKRCQYCFHPFDSTRHRRTAEHIIPKGIIDLYHEQYVSYIDKKMFIDNSGMTISDVCKHCNETLLGPLDSYGKDLIRSQFLEKLSETDYGHQFHKTFNYYTLSRWLLKILFNERRARNVDCSWFDHAHGYMLHGVLVENIAFSLFAGIHINTTPLPEEAYEYKPMQIIENPKLLISSLCITILGMDPYENCVAVPFADHTYCIRFGSAVFYCVLWNKFASGETKSAFDQLIAREFGFIILESDATDYELMCVSAHTNTVMGYDHLVSIAGRKEDREFVQSSLGGRTPTEVREQFVKRLPPEHMEKGKTLVEAIRFPSNKMIKKKFTRLFGNSTE